MADQQSETGARSNAPKGPRVLSDHKRAGKRFTPPFVATLGPLAEVRWIDDVLPEILWLSVINDSFGLEEGAELALVLPKAVQQVCGADHTRFSLAATSTYADLSPTEWTQIREATPTASANRLGDCLRPLIALYPECPLTGFLGDAVPSVHDEDVREVTRTVERVLDRASVAATRMQANAVYIAFVTGKLTVAKGLALANFPEVANYPATEESKRVASAVRAAVTIVTHFSDSPERPWPLYFWRRGMELAPCHVSEER